MLFFSFICYFKIFCREMISRTSNMGKPQLLSNSVNSDFNSKNGFICGVLVRAFRATNNSKTQWLRQDALTVCSAPGLWLGSG